MSNTGQHAGIMWGTFNRRALGPQSRLRYRWVPMLGGGALAVHLVLSSFFGLIQAGFAPTDSLRSVKSVATLLCTPTGMRSADAAPGSAGGMGGGLCAFCVPLVPEALPQGPVPSPQTMAFLVVRPAATDDGVVVLSHRRPPPRGPPGSVLT